MRILIALLALALTLSFVELGLGASDAQAAWSCKQRYNICLARCPANSQRCQRCRTQYRYCRYQLPYLGDLL